ncbi:MAG: carbonic anhydrase [Actinobacteria bacterium]|nr:carbonic anhydrase [Actinomycetota bacterium]MCB9388294.1 carbonic anhydrase [Acidimicrobiia bacterium]
MSATEQRGGDLTGFSDLIETYLLNKPATWGGVPKHEPKAAVLTCADARVTASFVFGRPQGELFVVRNAGNSATPSATASLDFAAAVLGIPLVFVMGHTYCGAVAGALSEESPAFLDPVLKPLRETIRTTGAATPDDLSYAHVLRVAEQLRAHDGPVGHHAAQGTLRVVPVVFDLSTGTLVDAESGDRSEVAM